MYYVIFGLLYVCSLLPLWLLYPISDALAFLLYHVIRYRRGVVAGNLKLAFPGETEAWRGKIARKFYRNFVDNFIETLKLLSASPAWVKKHYVLDNQQVLEDFYDQGRKCQLHLGHIFNWEMANSGMPLYIRYPFIAVYMPIENKYFNRLFLYMRARMGSIMLPATDMRRAILPYRNKQYLLGLVADQAPPHSDNAYWMNFLGTPTAFVRGPERGARAGDIPAVFVRFYKTRRGYYHAEFTTVADHPAQWPEGQLTKRYAHLMEEAIRRDPELWLWSHKRWKHPWKEEFSTLWVE